MASVYPHATVPVFYMRVCWKSELRSSCSHKEFLPNGPSLPDRCFLRRERQKLGERIVRHCSVGVVEIIFLQMSEKAKQHFKIPVIEIGS